MQLTQEGCENLLDRYDSAVDRYTEKVKESMSLF